MTYDLEIQQGLSMYMFMQSFMELSAAVNELSRGQRKKLRRRQYSPLLPRGL